MKKAIKYFAAVLAAALLCLSLVACGGSTKKYNFTEATIGGSAASMLQADDSSAMLTNMVAAFNVAYKDSSIEVGNGEIVWTYSDGEGKMTYTMDGDKYTLAGEMAENLKTLFPTLPAGLETTVEVYGEETDDGFHIVSNVAITATGQGQSVNLEIIFNFTNA